jgi:hypothetical protein
MLFFQADPYPNDSDLPGKMLQISNSGLKPIERGQIVQKLVHVGV